jgi:hypothetical protein
MGNGLHPEAKLYYGVQQWEFDAQKPNATSDHER